MTRTIIRFGVLASLVAGFASQAFGQCRFVQPWDGVHASQTSIVRSCANPEPVDVAALDDFVCENDSELFGIRWWGTLAVREQAGRPYYIAIYKDNGNCEPGELEYETCVVPRLRPVGPDCQGRRVFAFTAPVPPYLISGGQRYWLQISEVDAQSARSGVEDFRWSGRQPQQLCPAGQHIITVGFSAPLIDPCAGEPVDLSFALVGR